MFLQIYICTFSFTLIHNDSKSTALESLIHFSSNLFNCIDNSEGRPASKWGAPNGFNSKFIFNKPSLGLDDFGCCTSHDTCARTLRQYFRQLVQINIFTFYFYGDNSVSFRNIKMSN